MSVVVAFGTVFTFPFIQAAGERGGVATTRFALNLIEKLEKMLVRPGAVLAALFGIGLIFDDGTGYTDDFPMWLMIAITWFAAVFILAMTVQRSAGLAALAALDGQPDGPKLPDAYVAIAKRIQMVGGLLALSVVGILFLMVWKPGA